MFNAVTSAGLVSSTLGVGKSAFGIGIAAGSATLVLCSDLLPLES